jgi:hypothetical protein
VHGLEFPAVKLQVSATVQAVLKTVKLDESTFTKRNAKMFSAMVSETRHLEGIIQIEPSDFAWRKDLEKTAKQRKESRMFRLRSY